MPSKSVAQAKLMNIAAQSVGREFNLADQLSGVRAPNRRKAGRLQKALYRGPERRKAAY